MDVNYFNFPYVCDVIPGFLNFLDMQSLKTVRLLSHFWAQKIDEYTKNCDLGNAITTLAAIDFVLFNRIYSILENGSTHRARKAFNSAFSASKAIKTSSQILAAKAQLITYGQLQNQIKSAPVPKDFITSASPETMYQNNLFGSWFEAHLLEFKKQNKLSINGISWIPHQLLTLTNLTNLCCSDALHFGFPNLFELTNLTSLSLFNSNLYSVPKEIGKLTALRTMNLQCSNVHLLPEDIGSLTHLESLDISNNKLGTVPQELSMLNKLTHLSFNWNLLEQIPNELCKMTNLQMLVLQNNKLSSLPADIGCLTALRKLNIANNEISILPLSIIYLHQKSCQILHEENPLIVTFEAFSNILRVFKS